MLIKITETRSKKKKKKKKTLYMLGSSMVKKLNGYVLTKERFQDQKLVACVIMQIRFFVI